MIGQYRAALGLGLAVMLLPLVASAQITVVDSASFADADQPSIQVLLDSTGADLIVVLLANGNRGYEVTNGTASWIPTSTGTPEPMASIPNSQAAAGPFDTGGLFELFASDYVYVEAFFLVPAVTGPGSVVGEFTPPNEDYAISAFALAGADASDVVAVNTIDVNDTTFTSLPVTANSPDSFVAHIGLQSGENANLTVPPPFNLNAFSLSVDVGGLNRPSSFAGGSRLNFTGSDNVIIGSPIADEMAHVAVVVAPLDITPPTLDQAVVSGPLTVDVTYSEAMGLGVGDPSNYAISGTGQGTLATNPNSVALVSGTTYRLTWPSGEMFIGGDITITATDVEDLASRGIVEDGTQNVATDAGGGIGDVPTVTEIIIRDANTIDIVFTEAMGAAALTPANYTATGPALGTLDANPNGVSDLGGNRFRLTWPGGEPQNNQDLTITAANLADEAGNPLGTPDSATDTVPGTGVGTPPSLVSVTVESLQSILVEFSEPMNADAELAASYAVSGSGQGSFAATPDSVALDVGSTYRLTWNAPQEMRDGGDIAITAALTLEDQAGNSLALPNTVTDVGGGQGVAPMLGVDTLATADDTPALSGTVDDPDAVLTLTVGAQIDVPVTNNMDGTWSLADDVLSTLIDGTYDVLIRGTDAAGNIGVDMTTSDLVVDTTPPSSTVDSLVTRDGTPPLGGTIDDPTATVSLLVHGQSVPATNNGNGTWSLANNVLTTIPDGLYDVVLTATDTLGNVGTDSTVNELRIDTEEPIITVNPLITGDDTPSIAGTIDDTTASIQITVAGQTVSALNGGDGTWIAAGLLFSPIADGTYDVQASAQDAAGNQGVDTSTDELTVDTAILTDVIDPEFSNILVDSDEVVAGDTVLISFTASEILLTRSDVFVTTDSNPALFVSENGLNYVFAYTVQDDDPFGETVITVVGVDLAGNFGATNAPEGTLTILDPTPVPVSFWPAIAAIGVAAALILRRRQ